MAMTAGATKVVAAGAPHSVLDAISQALERCHEQDARLNSFITLSETARLEAATLDRQGAQGRPLYGMPLGVKDLIDTAGLRTTYGSAIYRDHIPQQDDILVARAKAAGAVIIGKTNTPEFGFGAICANALCASTANPHDLSLSSGGSSGGSAAAVAAGLVPAALGTDFGGSVRTPAAFCGVIGYRPSIGLLPAPTRRLAWDTLSTAGFLTQTVDQSRRLLDALAGPDPRDPVSLRMTAAPAGTSRRLSASRDLGTAPMSRDIAARFDMARAALHRAGFVTQEDHPDCTGAMATFATLRAAHIHSNLAIQRDLHDAVLSPTVRWNIERGNGLSAATYLQAEADRSALYRRFIDFFSHADILITPAAAILPFGREAGEVNSIDNQPMNSVIDYLAITAIITLTGCPALSLPYWPPGENLPIGLQLIAAPGRDHDLLAFASELEQLDHFGFRPPALFSGNF